MLRLSDPLSRFAVATTLTVIASRAAAQSIAAIRMTEAAVSAGAPAACNLSVKRGPSKQSTTPDTLSVGVYSDDALTKPGKAPVRLVLLLDNASVDSLPAQAGQKSIAVGVAGLSDRIVRIRRGDSDADLCNFTPVPLIETAVLPNFTDFIADGAISAALRTGAGATEATGSLGIHHRRTKGVRERFPGFLGRRGLPVDGEELRATISVAGTSDVLQDSLPGTFAQAVLAPETATRGSLGSMYLEYHPYEVYGNQSQFRGLWFSALLVQSRWRTIPHVREDGTRSTLDLAKNVSISTLDVRYRWSPIARMTDARGNTFRFSLDLGYTSHWLDGDGGRNSEFLKATLGTSQRVFHGPVGAVAITLRQVTAIAELPYFVHSATENLEGLQPVIRFRFEAPMFSFGQ